MGSLPTWTTVLPCHLSQLSAQNKHTLMLTKAIMMRRHIVVVFQVIATGCQKGHIDLNVSKQPHPRGAYHSKQWHSIWVDRLNSQPIASYMATTTLYSPSIPSQGLHMLSSLEGQVLPPASPVITNCSFYLPQQFYFFQFPSCF